MDYTAHVNCHTVSRDDDHQVDPVSSLGDVSPYSRWLGGNSDADEESTTLTRHSSESSLNSVSTFVVDTERDSLGRTDIGTPTIVNSQSEEQLSDVEVDAIVEKTQELDLSNVSAEEPAEVLPPIPAKRRIVVSPNFPSTSEVTETIDEESTIDSIQTDISMLIETNDVLSKLLVEQQRRHENEIQTLKDELNSLKCTISGILEHLETPPPITGLRSKDYGNEVHQVEWDLKTVHGYEIILNGERAGDIVQQRKCFVSDVSERTSVQIQAIGANGIRGEVSDPLIIRPDKK